MRTFSALTQAAHCAHPELLDFEHAPNPRRQAAAELGTEWHTAVVDLIEKARRGETFYDSGYSPQVRRWVSRMRDRWQIPADVECEVALGIGERDGEPVYIEVKEDPPGSHFYMRTESGPPLLSAGRADLIYPDPSHPLVVNVVDLKSGAAWLGSPDRVPQIMAQSLAAALRGGYVSARPGVLYARIGMVEWGRLIVANDRDAWATVREAALRSTDPRTGGWCLSCYSKDKCDAFARIVA
jgi:hypothetical protein